LARGTISISLGDLNLNYLKTFHNHLRLHTLNPTPSLGHKHQPFLFNNPSFEDKVLQALKELETNTQLLHSYTQSIAKLETQMSQLAEAITRRKYETLPSQAIETLGGSLGLRILSPPISFMSMLRL